MNNNDDVRKRVSIEFTEKERDETSRIVIPNLIKSIRDISDNINIENQDTIYDQVYDAIYNKILETILKYDSLYKRLIITNSVYGIGLRFGYKYTEFMFPNMYSKLFDHKFLADDDFNIYDPLSLNNIESAEELAKNIFENCSYNFGYYNGYWRDLGKCKTCDRHVLLNYGEFYRYYFKISPKYNKYFPVHCEYCRLLKKYKKRYKLTFHNFDGSRIDDVSYKYIKNYKKRIKKQIDILSEKIYKV